MAIVSEEKKEVSMAEFAEQRTIILALAYAEIDGGDAEWDALVENLREGGEHE